MPTLADLRTLAKAGSIAVAVVRAVKGSAPREEGAWMAITPGGILGTIGGGEAELRTTIAARRLLAEHRARETLELPLGPELDQCCGGHMTVEIAVVDGAIGAAQPLWDGGPVLSDPVNAPVIVYGAGHVGAALVTALVPLPFSVTWVDGRHESEWAASASIPCQRLAIPETAAAAAPDDAIHVVLTHSHALDLEIVAAILVRPHRFCGLIGSATKRAVFISRLRERGIVTDTLTCPIGLPGIEGKVPAIIAASATAQLLSL
ncbi:MAG: xanthine dehydrogenase accessory protein XdhC [Pseudomonadota bacterium]